MLFTFPSRYWFTIGLSEVFSLTGWSRPILTGFLVPRDTQDTARPINSIRIRDFHPLRCNVPGASASIYRCHGAVLQPPNCLNNPGLGCSPFARHYLGNHFCFLFLRVLRCFSSPGLPTIAGVTESSSAGLPHSDICGSKVICTYPQLFAAYHVLLRLREPRHPPCALICFLLFFPFLKGNVCLI